MSVQALQTSHRKTADLAQACVEGGFCGLSDLNLAISSISCSFEHLKNTSLTSGACVNIECFHIRVSLTV